MAGLLRIQNALGRDDPVLVVSRHILERDRQVYFHVGNRSHQYKDGRNRILYIGTTSKGHSRLLSSLADSLESGFDEWGVNEIEVHRISCIPRQKVKTWLKLERACLMVFREIYGALPVLNKKGHKMQEDDEFEYFSRDTVERTILRWARKT